MVGVAVAESASGFEDEVSGVGNDGFAVSPSSVGCDWVGEMIPLRTVRKAVMARTDSR